MTLLVGRIDRVTTRPQLEGLLSLPDLGVIGEPVSFLVDTGATSCLLGPTDILRLEPDLTVLEHRDTAWGISGPEECLITNGYVFFEDTTGVLHAYEVPKFFISQRVPPGPLDGIALMMTPPSLLGMDILRHWRSRLSPSEGIVEFGVLRADVSYPRPQPLT